MTRPQLHKKLIQISLMIPLTFIGLPALGQISPNVFANLMEVHRSRLVHLGLGVLANFPSDFDGLDRSLLIDYLRLHDQPKVLSLNALRALGYAGDRAILDRLAEMYGRSLRELNPQDQAEMLAVIENMNTIERELKNQFLGELGVSNEVRRALERVERIVDVTDTGIARSVEMGISRVAYDGAKYLTQRDQDDRAAGISRWVEDHYSAILSSAPACRALF